MQTSLTLLSTLALLFVLVGADRQGTGRRIQNNSGGSFRSPCGTSEQVSSKVGECLKPLFALAEGKFPKIPVVDSDFEEHCNKFIVCEKCLRTLSKDCFQGLHKTAVGAFASSTNRFRRQECKNEITRAKFRDPMKCVKTKGDDTARVYRNMTGIAQAIRDLKIEPEEKMIKVCCLLKELDRELETRFNSECPTQTQAIMNIIHSVTDDARGTLCLNPKCQGSLNAVAGAKLKQQQSFIEPVMQILLMISTE